MELVGRHLNDPRVPQNFTELCRCQIKCHQVPWNSVEFGGHHFKWQQGSMEYSAEFHGTACAKSNVRKFHEIPWHFEIITLIDIRSVVLPLNMPWNSWQFACPWLKQLTICQHNIANLMSKHVYLITFISNYGISSIPKLYIGGLTKSFKCPRAQMTYQRMTDKNIYSMTGNSSLGHIEMYLYGQCRHKPANM